MNNIEKLQEMVNNSNRIVFFGGAGVSTESGIPDFRSVDGLYNQKYDYPPEQILSHSFFMAKREEFYKFYYDKIMVDGIEPNPAHYKLAEMENVGKLTAIVTQNIDGLHQKAGSKVVYELHGGVSRNYCMDCGAFYDVDYIMEQKHNHVPVPKCTKCGGDIKPDVVLYEEGLDSDTMAGAMKVISEADMLIIGGTSLVVYPAAGMVNYYSGDKLVLLNKSSTSQDSRANLIIAEPIGKVLAQIKV